MPVGCGAAAVKSAKSCRASMVCIIDSGFRLVSRYCAIAMDIGFVRNCRGPLLGGAIVVWQAEPGAAAQESSRALPRCWLACVPLISPLYVSFFARDRQDYGRDRTSQEGVVAMFGVGDVEAGRREILVVGTGLGLLSQAPRTRRSSSCKSTSCGPKSACKVDERLFRVRVVRLVSLPILSSSR